MPWLSSELPGSPSVLGDFQSLTALIWSYKGFCCLTFYPKYLNSEVQIGFYHILQPDQPYRLHLTQTYSRWRLYPGWKRVVLSLCKPTPLCSRTSPGQDKGHWRLTVFCDWDFLFLLFSLVWQRFLHQVSSFWAVSTNPSQPTCPGSIAWALVQGNRKYFTKIIPQTDFLKLKFFWPCHDEACGILISQPGIQPMPPALEVQWLNHWTTREVPDWFCYVCFFF